jgi:hypothetical protein
MWDRFWTDLIGRLSGPLDFRLILQPLMALVLAVRDGMRDAHQGRSPYFWSLLTEPENRRDRTRSAWHSVGRVVILALVLDAVYEIIEFRWIYPGQAMVVALLVAVIPYVVMRGPVNRLTRWWMNHHRVPAYRQR